MHLAIWIFLLMFVTNAAQGYDDERLLERLAEKEEEGIDAEQQPPHHQQQQQRGGWRGGIRGEAGEGRGGGRAGVRTPVSSTAAVAANPPAPHLIPDSIHWKEDDYDSPASSSSLRRGGGRGRTPGSRSRHSSSPSPPPHAVASTDEPYEAASTPPSSRPPPHPHHLLLPSSASSSSVSDDDSLEEPRRHKTSQRGRLNGSRGLVAHSVCPSQTEWKRLREARDINGTVVEIFQPSHGGGGGGQRRQGGRGGGGGGGDAMRWTQWFYVVSCRNHVFQSERQCENCCIGIDHTRYTSSCEQRQSYVIANIRRPWQKRFSWDYILINSGCSCAITSTHEDL